MIHLWVDPHYGDNALAAAYNANLTNVPSAPPGYAPSVKDPSANQVLLNESWPFKTITAAVNFLPPLPYAGMYASWDFAIIHALPGWYARADVNYEGNGLLPNGETFPIHLPDRVSVQGTSALNTVFDLNQPAATGPFGPAFEFGAVSGKQGVYSFIDSVSIFGAESGDGTSNPSSYCGIYLVPQFPSAPTITNCFVFGNTVGICVDAPIEVEEWHEPRLVNNTIAWNIVGLWNGQSATRPADCSGVSKLVLVNNIFDASKPAQMASGYLLPKDWRNQGASRSDFEGVDQSDLQVLSPLPPGVSGAAADFNAYERAPDGTAKFNTGWSQLPQFPATSPRTTNPILGPSDPAVTPGIPLRNIARFTGFGSSSPVRGVLFIRDLLYNAFAPVGPGGSVITPPSPDFDLSPGDFRLSPSVAEAGLDPSTNQPWPPGDALHGALNPLVDNGWQGQYPGGFALTMANGVALTEAPGALPFGSTTGWYFTSWEEDCEGYGNPRIVDHNAYPPQPYPGASTIDIGADEVADLIGAGYRFGTTHFQEDFRQLNGMKPAQNNYLFWLGPAYVGVANAGRPHFTWYMQDNWDYGAVAGRGYYWPGRADVVPHLLPDIHPWWLGQWGLPWPSNPIWEPWLVIHNPALFANAAFGVINPTGSGTGNATTYRWLDFTYFTGSPAQFGPLGAPGSLFLFDAWCMPYLPPPPPPLTRWDDVSGLMTSGMGMRYSVEFPAPTLFGSSDSNLQTFMIWKP